MTFTDFVMCFTEADVCLTRTYDTNFQAIGLRIPGGGSAASATATGRGGGGWGTYTIPEDIAKQRLMFTVLEGTDVHATVSQSFDDHGGAGTEVSVVGDAPFTPEPSTPHRHDRRHVDVMILVLRLVRGRRGGGGGQQQQPSSVQDAGWVLHGAPSRCACDAAMTHTFYCPPGEYCVVPMSVAGTHFTPTPAAGRTTSSPKIPMLSLNVTILSESRNILAPSPNANATSTPRFPPLSHILYCCCRSSPTCRKTESLSMMLSHQHR